MTIDPVLLPTESMIVETTGPDAIDKDRQLLALCRVRCDECRVAGKLFGPGRRWVVIGETAHQPAKIYCSECATAEQHG